MTDALDLFQACQFVVYEILQGDRAHDQQAFVTALDHIIEGVRAGRRNQDAFPRVAAELAARGVFSVRVDEPHLTLVKGEQ